MKTFLFFQLHGPLQAWGEIAVGEVRNTLGAPTRSGVMGLLAAALGIRRHESERFQSLSDAYGVAVRIDAPGRLLRDFHTVQTPRPPRKRMLHTRREELAVEKLGGRLNTILSTRDYLTDARFVVCLWQRGTEAPYTLDELTEALKKPCFILYLGRKSCPPALPLNPVREDHPDIKTALRSYLPSEKERRLYGYDDSLAPGQGTCVQALWDTFAPMEDPDGASGSMRIACWDRVVDVANRQFGPRDVCQGEITLGSG